MYDMSKGAGPTRDSTWPEPTNNPVPIHPPIYVHQSQPNKEVEEIRTKRQELNMPALQSPMRLPKLPRISRHEQPLR